MVNIIGYFKMWSVYVCVGRKKRKDDWCLKSMHVFVRGVNQKNVFKSIVIVTTVSAADFYANR